ncbi:hypothetical protein [Streptomyces sp. NPDC046821]|uniref:hypothetical protein n=1 Tax=Streptomyces sp. NPDC046821 TaxID=3154702 RepID=UPI0033D31676
MKFWTSKNTNEPKDEPGTARWSSRAWVLAVLGAFTLGVAALSMKVTYSILVPHFGPWAVPTVGALDALWVVLQATEILSGNNRTRVNRVRWAGLALTAVLAAVPPADLILTSRGAGLDLAVVLTPVAIALTKGVWWLVLPSLGRSVSPSTRQAIADRRQTVVDRLEEMEAEAAHKIELLGVAKDLNLRVTKAETEYRLSALKAQQEMTDELHTQAQTTAQTISKKVLPELVSQIELPELEGWEPAAPELPVTPVTQVRALMGPESGTPRVTPVTLEELATVAGVTVPRPGEPLDDDQLDVVVRYLRYSDDPPRSYRATAKAMREAGFMGSEERVRHAWREVVSKESVTSPDAAETNNETDEEMDDEAEEPAEGTSR